MSASAICVDASFVVRMFVGPDDAAAWALWDAWLGEGRALHAPQLLTYEVANALHRYRRAGILSPTAAERALDAALGLPVRFETSAPLHLEALRLASVLDLPAAYDAHYLALARQLDADLWTADARLARVEGHGMRVRLLGAESTPG